MPEISSYKDGQFCWVDLTTTDPKAARSFYTSLFGWSVNDMPMGDQGVYSMLQINGKDVAALAGMRDEEKKQGIPPHWNNYVSVSNADAAAKQAKSLGGNVIAGPFDVMDAGRMAFIADPQGAVFAVWQPKRHIGATVIQRTERDVLDRADDIRRRWRAQILFGTVRLEAEGLAPVHRGPGG